MKKKKIKKYKIDDEALLEKIINLELKPYKITYKSLKKESKLNEFWFQGYRFNNAKEWRKWRKDVINILLNQVTPKISKDSAIRTFNNIDFTYGLALGFPIKEIINNKSEIKS